MDTEGKGSPDWSCEVIEADIIDEKLVMSFGLTCCLGMSQKT